MLEKELPRAIFRTVWDELGCFRLLDVPYCSREPSSMARHLWNGPGKSLSRGPKARIVWWPDLAQGEVQLGETYVCWT